MPKILVVFNGVAYASHVVDFARKVAKDSGSLLHAVFSKTRHVSDSLQYPFPNDLSITEGSADKEEEARTDLQAIEDNKQVFRDDCQVDKIAFKVDEEVEIELEDLLGHSRFSDLVVADVNDDLGKYSLKEFLEKAHCPVVLVQRQTEAPAKVVLAYDGTASSILAMKMYSYILPQWRNVNTLLVQVNPESSRGINKEKYLRDWLDQHFTNLEISTLKGDVENEFTTLLDTNSERTMLVMGAYGKKGVSGLFHESLAKKLIDVSYASFFIAHE